MTARQPAGTTVGGQFAATAHAAPDVTLAPAGGIDRFPNPDTNYPHPMTQWPEGIEHPVSIELDTESVFSGYSSGDQYDRDPRNEIDNDRPTVKLAMANGATAFVKNTSFEESEFVFEGDWDAYTGGNSDVRDAIQDVVGETYSQAEDA